MWMQRRTGLILAPWLLSGYYLAMECPTSTRHPRSGAAADALTDDLEKITIGAVGLTTRALANAGAGFELTFPQWRTLLVLGEDMDGARISEVAARVGVTVPATSRLIRRLERRGLTTLAVDDRDRRAMRARLTDQGRSVRSAILAHRRNALREVVGALAEGDRHDLAAGLAAIAARLRPYS